MAMKSITVGTVFGRLTVVGIGDPVYQKCGKLMTTSNCRCECGTVKTIKNARLKNGYTKSCGCLRVDVSTKNLDCIGNENHGMARTPEYLTWVSMIQRCENTKHKSYGSYGGRGITVSPIWRNSFEEFVRSVGERTSTAHSIDRINNDGNYEPGNCRWATRTEQCNNRRSSVAYTFYGKTMTLVEWSRIAQISSRTIHSRRQLGWPGKSAVWTPLRKHTSRIGMTPPVDRVEMSQ